jgi:hypothetical protein
MAFRGGKGFGPGIRRAISFSCKKAYRFFTSGLLRYFRCQKADKLAENPLPNEENGATMKKSGGEGTDIKGEEPMKPGVERTEYAASGALETAWRKIPLVVEGTIKSDNPGYDPMKVDDKAIRVVARMLWLIHIKPLFNERV